MKFTSLFPVALAVTSALASATSLTRNYDVVKARQAKVQRDLLDICAGLDVDLKVDLLNKDIVVGHLDVCLCVSLIPTFIKTNIIAQAGVVLVGEAKVSALIEALIGGSKNKQSCHFPTHSHSICSGSNPCGFGCDDGYSPYTAPGDKYPSLCNCPLPYTECNGKCGSFPHGCGSAVPVKRRNNRRSEPACPTGSDVCGVFGSNGWDCVDTQNDRESCGGCLVPSPFKPHTAAAGVDCTAIAHVDIVDCLRATCFVRSCKDGFVPNAAQDACIPVEAILNAGADVHIARGRIHA